MQDKIQEIKDRLEHHKNDKAFNSRLEIIYIKTLLDTLDQSQNKLNLANKMIDTYQQEIIPGFREVADKSQDRERVLREALEQAKPYVSLACMADYGAKKALVIEEMIEDALAWQVTP